MIPKATAPARAARIVTMAVQQVRMLCFGELMARVTAAWHARGCMGPEVEVIELIDFVRWSPQNKKAQLDDR